MTGCYRKDFLCITVWLPLITLPGVSLDFSFKMAITVFCCNQRCIITYRNQRTSGPVNAHLTSGPGIDFNAFIHVYSPIAGKDNSLGTNVDVNRQPLSLCPFVAGLKKNEVRFYIHLFHVSPYIYSSGQGQTIHWGQNFDDNRKAFSLYPYITSFKMISSKSDFNTHF